jgi:ABC-type multidrug transport system fused ATPase/permease subunit
MRIPSPIGILRAILARAGAMPDDPDGLVEAAPRVPIPGIIRRFAPFIRPYARWLLIGLVPVAILPVIETIEIWLFQVVVDQVLVPRDLDALPTLVVAFVGLTLASGALSYADDVIGTRVAASFTLDVRTALFANLLRQPPDALDTRRLGDVLSRLSGDVGAVEGLMVDGASALVSAVLRMVFFAGAMLLIDAELAVVSLLLAPLFWGAARLFASTARKVARERRRRSGTLLALAEESLGHVALVQASGQEAAELARFDREGAAVAEGAVAAARVRSLLLPVVDVIEVLGALVITGLGTLALAADRVTLGELLVFLAYLTQLYRPVRDLGELTTVAFAAAGGAERIIEVLDQPPGVMERPGARDPGRALGDVALDHVGYAYPGAGQALDDVSLVFPAGSVTAVVGPSGAGKSTLVKLLLRFADVTSGRVLLDGEDVRELTLHGLRRNVGVLLQEIHVLDTSLVENVRYARPDATDAEVEGALAAADAAGFTASLGKGGATRLAQKGRRLSGGERQRIGIARLLVQDAPVVVLDEPTAALDRETAARVMRAIRVALAGRTIILVTHDPVAMEVADRVVRLERGRLVTADEATWTSAGAVVAA